MTRHQHNPSCINCQKRKAGYLFEIRALEDGDPDFTDVLGRAYICIECASDPIVQQTIVTVLVEESKPS